MRCELRFSGNNLTLEGQTISFPYKILNASIMNDTVVVTFSWDEEGVDPNRNLIGYTATGEILWIVQDRPNSELQWGVTNINPFIGVKMQSNGTVHAMTFNGLDYKLDLTNGEVCRDKAHFM